MAKDFTVEAGAELEKMQVCLQYMLQNIKEYRDDRRTAESLVAALTITNDVVNRSQDTLELEVFQWEDDDS